MQLGRLVETFTAAKVFASNTRSATHIAINRQGKLTLIYLCTCGCNCISHSRAWLVELGLHLHEAHSYVVGSFDLCSKLCQPNLAAGSYDHQSRELKVQLVEFNCKTTTNIPASKNASSGRSSSSKASF